MVGSSKIISWGLRILPWFFCIGLVILFIYDHGRSSYILEERENLLLSMEDTLRVWKDAQNKEHARISILETEKIKTFTALKVKDSAIAVLQEIVSAQRKKLEKGGSVTYFETDTKLDTTILRVSEARIDSRNCLSDSIYRILLPLQEWGRISIEGTKDSAKLRLNLKNKYSVVIGSEKTGFFKKPRYYAEITSYNPYTSTTAFRTYQVKFPRKKHFSIGPYIGVGLDHRLKFSVSVGIGIQWMVFKF